MSALWTAGDALRATGARGSGDWRAHGVSIDTRTIEAGDLFVALKDVRDGHDFVADAFAKGAAAALVSRVPDGVPAGAPLLVVDDVLAGLVALAAAARRRGAARVIAVTGSVGKTSTKDMLRDVLGRQGRVHAAEASFNNHWGVPLTLARMPRDADFAVIEIGMNHPGEIAPLSRLARPDVAIVTTVAAAHMEAFESLDAIAREKAAIFQGLEPGGAAIVNGDIGTTGILTDAAVAAGAVPVSFGAGDDCTFRLSDLTLVDDTSVVNAALRDQPILFKLASPGRHFATNALAVLAAVDAVGADIGIAACDLARWSPPRGRGRRETVPLDPVEDDLTIDLIDDAYNANPASMSAALDVLGAARTTDGIGRVAQGRRIAVLGDMLELGADEMALHAGIAAHPAMAGIARVHCVGPRIRALWEALPEPQRGAWVARADDLVGRAHTLVDAGDVVLVKGSKASRVSLIVDAIRKLGQSRPARRQGV